MPFISADQTNRVNREKRFTTTIDELGHWWSDNENFIFTYDYSDRAKREDDYIDRLEVFVDDFNKLGLIQLVHKDLNMGSNPTDCSIDVDSIMAKYGNPILFDIEPDKSGTTVCSSRHYTPLYKLWLQNAVQNGSSPLFPLGKIWCNVNHTAFQQYGSGILVHEFFHLLSILHTHAIEDTQGILVNNQPKPEFETIKRGEFTKYLSIYDYGDQKFLPKLLGYGLASPFSIMHYTERALQPFKSFNRSTISTLLERYNFSESNIEKYLTLLDQYAGKAHLLTHQDILGLAIAHYQRVPMSLVHKAIDLPDYYPLQGIYRAPGDLEDLVELLQSIKKAEGFKYPLLVQKNITLEVETGRAFETDLIREAKAVSLNGPIHCRRVEEQVQLHEEKGTLSLREDCRLLGIFKHEGITQLAFLMENRSNSSEEISILLKARTKSIPRILLGKKAVNYQLKTKNPTLDLIELCRAVALPVGSPLQCKLDTKTLDDRLNLSQCQLQLDFQEDFTDLTTGIVFSNHQVEKTCILHLHTNDNTSLLSLGHASTNLTSEQHYLWHNNHQGQIDSSSVSVSLPVSKMQGIQAYSYFTLIPLLQGAFEGLIDTRIDNTHFQSGVKLLSRLILMPFSAASFMGFGVITLTSGLEAIIKANKTGNKYLANLLTVTTFILLAELEYGIFDLYESIGKSGDCSSLVDKMNKVFINHAFAPAMKVLGYEVIKKLSLKYLSKHSLSNESREENNPPLLLKKNKVPVTSQKPDSFLTATTKAADTVFSSRFKQTFFTPFQKTRATKPEEGTLLSSSKPN